MGNIRQPKEVSDEKYRELVRAQNDELEATLDLCLNPDYRKYLIPHTIHGRALMGHGNHFNGYARPNLPIDYIYQAINLDPLEARAKKQEMMEEVLFCIDDLIDGKKKTLTDRTGRPLYGVSFLEDFPVEVDKEFFKGGALVGRMDTPYWREKTKQVYPKNIRKENLKLGFGEELPINVEKMKENNLTFTSLSDTPHDLESLNSLREKGVIVSGEDLEKGQFENFFVRYSSGCGVCDDASLVSVGLLHGKDAMILGFLVDATDTHTKCCQNKVVGGFDEFLGAHIEKRWQEKYNEPLLSDKETTDIIYLGAKETLKVSCFSSSHRRLIQYEETTRPNKVGKLVYKKQEMPTILNHLRFVTHGEAHDFDLGFDRFHSLAFYENMRERFRKTGREYFLPRRTPCQ